MGQALFPCKAYVYMGVGSYRDSIGIMEKNMETTKGVWGSRVQQVWQSVKGLGSNVWGLQLSY